MARARQAIVMLDKIAHMIMQSSVEKALSYIVYIADDEMRAPHAICVVRYSSFAVSTASPSPPMSMNLSAG